MDWDKIILPTPKNTLPKCGDLHPYDYWRLHIAAKQVRKSMAQVLQTAVLIYLARNWDEHERRLTLEARNQGKTPEEYFLELCQK